MTILEPDRDQIEIYINALFRHAAPQGFVSLRAFHDNSSNKVFRITPIQLTGGLPFLIDAFEDDARRAAQAPGKVVFCPPVATFTNKQTAGEKDLAQGLALSVECDANAQQARVTLEQILGPPTVTVASGGKWKDPATGELQDKLHLHWRLAIPAQGADLAILKEARDFATRIVGGDPSNKPACHPIRCPGSWHRKADPVLCSIDTVYADKEIDLSTARSALKVAAPPDTRRSQGNGTDHTGGHNEWPSLIAAIVSGQSYHEPLVRLAAMYVAAGMQDAAIVNALRGLMEASAGARDERWQSRSDDIPRTVRSAREKMGQPVQPPVLTLAERDAGDDTGPIPPRRWLLGNQFCRKFLSSLIAPGGTGKSALRLLQLISLAIGRALTGQHVFRRCRVLLLSFEDDLDELHRRMAAVLVHHRIARAELKGWLFYAAPKGLKLVEMAKGSRQIGQLEKLLREAIERRKPDIIGLDPFIKLHALEENDNGAMDFVCDLLTTLAIELDIAVDVPHHARKGNQVAGDADAGRGASGIRDAGRLVYTLTRMTPEEATAFGIPELERAAYVRIDSAKVNITPSAQNTTWFKLVSVQLNNGTAEYPNGDDVQTVVPWSPPSTWANLSTAILNEVLTKIDAGMENEQRCSDAPAATARAAWTVVQRHCLNKSEQQCREIIRTWVKNGVLFHENYDDPVERKSRSGLRLNVAKRPG